MSNLQNCPPQMTAASFEEALKALVHQGLKEGRIGMADLDDLLSKVTLTAEDREKIRNMVRDMGIDLIPEKTESEAEADTSARDRLMRTVQEILAQDVLTWQEAEILRMRFGLADGRTHTLEEVAQAFGVTRERIRMVENKTIRRHRGHIHRKRIRDFYL